MTTGTTPATSSNTQAYGEAWYWDNRYAQDPSTFDWYQKYPSLAPLLRLYIPRHHPILVVGCGNSAFSEDMVDDGYDEVVNIDISSVVIEAMQKKYSNRLQLKYMTMDVRDMSAFDTKSFIAVIDKGTLDSLLCGHNSRQNAVKMLEEVWRVLKDKGVYILITYGSPVYRLPLLKELSWTIKLHVIDKLPSGNSSRLTRDLTSPIPLDANGGPQENVVGMDTDVHYIYVCVKDNSGKSEA
ncbi:Endothelin-converting enzyme 1 [Handroanthus impetiginosus]|uniref:Endothelin-converting enzyme 1 n=1 Tax=Handroanthus impetiginosus TaxID=429701 RepID=A0A2G9HPK7_9LAMI|nr:Endothelin-converting enzyme 1 [Handroanthus impetiginosus]